MKTACSGKRLDKPPRDGPRHAGENAAVGPVKGTDEWTRWTTTGGGEQQQGGPHLGERDADGVSETVQEKRADADGRLHASVLALASLAAETSPPLARSFSFIRDCLVKEYPVHN